MDEKLDIIAMGECLVELSTDLSLQDAECLNKYFGGDALTTAVAAARLGSRVGFITKLGNDAFKNFFINAWKSEGLDTSQVTAIDERNGLYLIARPDAQGKEFAYYRKKIAPTKLSINDISEEYIASSKIVYASGITQSLSLSAREAVKAAFQIAKEKNILTAYDPNFLPQISTIDDAREYFDEILPHVDILFMSAKYDLDILGIESIDAVIKHLWDNGVSIVVIKSATENGYYTGYNGVIKFTEFYTHDVCDTTCSGDVFNGGFMHGITSGCTPFEATELASIAAGMQAKGIGAIKSIPYHRDVYSAFRGEQSE